MRIALIATAFCALLCGCGQKGPLFIPEDNTAPASAAQPQAN